MTNWKIDLEISKEVERSQDVYSKPVLSLYDFWVLGVSNKYIWKCPTDKLLAHFDENISSNHLDIGVGTGYFLDQCRFPSDNIRIALLDLNQNSLDKAGKRIKRYNPIQYKFNVLDEIKIDMGVFDSISLNYLFHCLPGKLSEKLVVLYNVDHLLSETGTVFGTTILSSGVKKNRAATMLMSIYNKKGILNNSEDTCEDLENYLLSNYSSYNLSIHGCVALFSASK